MRTFLCLSLLSVAPALAQTTFTTFTTPPLALPQISTDIPFASGVGRYQQWYSANEIRTGLGQPMRILRMQFLAGAPVSAITTTLDLEVAIGHGFGSGLVGAFDSNFATPKVTVLPRTTLALAPGPTGSTVLTINFATLFTWDGDSPLVVEVRLFGNGRGNQPFAYNFLGTAQGFGRTNRCYQGGNANASTGTLPLSGAWGLFTVFTARPGAAVAYGNGCPGANFVVPVATVQQIPAPGILWTHALNNAGSQRLTCLVLGDSRTQWGPATLPLDLSPFLGAGGCFLLASPIATFFTTTVGSPGAGFASLDLPLPPTTGYIGMSVFSQWLVADPAAINGVLSASGGIWSIVAPVGG